MKKVILKEIEKKKDNKFSKKIKKFVKKNEFLTRDSGNTNGHLTASIFVLSSDRTKCLLCKHKKLGKWLQLGGHVDIGELPIESAVREVKEESGLNVRVLGLLDMDIHTIPENKKKKESEHLHYDFRYIAIVEGDETPTVSDESDSVEWIKLEEIKNLNSDNGFQRMSELAIKTTKG